MRLPFMWAGFFLLGFFCRHVAVGVESPPTLSLGHIDAVVADFWTSRMLLLSSRSTAEELASERSHTRTLKSD